MTKIDPSADLINALRAQLATRTKARKADSGSEASAPEQTPAQATVVSTQEIKKRIGRQLKQLNLESEIEKHYARKIFLESILAWDFGDQILNDKTFDFILKDIEDALNLDPNVSKTFDKLLVDLQKAGDT